VAIVSGTLFSIMAFTGALGHHFCGKMLRRYPVRAVIAGGSAVAAAGSGLFGLSGNFWMMAAASVMLGLGIGAAMTASYSAAGAVIPPGAHGAGFGVLTSASLVGMASSPFIAGFVGGASIRIVFIADLVLMALLAAVVQKTMAE
jgi:MFS family permease